jgi:DNA-binding transcriptional ArsR family regulator
MRKAVLLLAALALAGGAAAQAPDAGRALQDLQGDGGVSGAVADLGAGDAGATLSGLGEAWADTDASLVAQVVSTVSSGLFERVADGVQPVRVDTPGMPTTQGAADTTVVQAALAEDQAQLDAALAGALPAQQLDALTAAPLDAAHDTLRGMTCLACVALPPLPALPAMPEQATRDAPTPPALPALAPRTAGAPIGVPGAQVADAPPLVEQLRLMPLPAEQPAAAERLVASGAHAPERATATVLDPVATAAVVAPALLALIGGLLFAPSLYHRVQQESSLDHPGRRALYEAIVASPGCTIQSAARASGLSRGTAVHHLRILARHRLVLQRPGTKEVHLFPNTPGFEGALAQHLSLLARPRTREIAALVAAEPGLTRTEVAQRVGITPSTLDWHLGQLLQSGLVAERLEGRRRALMPGDALAPALARGQAPLPPVALAQPEPALTMPPA